MPIYQRGKSFQVKLLDSNNRWITKTFGSRREAELYEARTRAQKLGGQTVLSASQQPTLDEYFEQWFETIKYQASAGWREMQDQLYRRYVSPVIGTYKIHKVNPTSIAAVLNGMKEKGLGEQTQLHVYGILRKMMRDAMELFHLIPHSPIHKSMRPRVAVKEARHLTLEQLKKLLSYVTDKPYGLGVWLQAYLGLRVGELQALRWSEIDLNEGIVRICRNFVRKENTFRDYPKGRKQHSHRIPRELLAMLREAKAKSEGEYVVKGTDGGLLRYEWYHRTLRRYAKKLELPPIGTHGLRHSTSELYMAHGATADDLRKLFAHSSSRVTDRYVHDRGTRLERISESIKLFDETPDDEPKPPVVMPTVNDSCGEVLSQIFPKTKSANVIQFRRHRSS